MNQNTKYINEIRIVRELGERIGYGNMMTIAAALWTLKLREDGVKRTPPRVVTNLSSLSTQDRAAAQEEIENEVSFIQAFVPPRQSVEQQLENILNGINEDVPVNERISL